MKDLINWPLFNGIVTIGFAGGLMTPDVNWTAHGIGAFVTAAFIGWLCRKDVLS